MPKKASKQKSIRQHSARSAKSKSRSDAELLQAQKDAANAQAQNSKGRSGRLSTGKKVAIGIFSLFIALSMMIPSLSMIFGGGTSKTTVSKVQTQTPTPDSVNAQYAAQEKELTDDLSGNPNNLAATLKLAQVHLNWGVALRKVASDDTTKQQADDHIKQALSEYDVYLASSDSDTVRADRAVAQFQSGDQEGAVTALKNLTEKSPDCAAAWLNLGMIYLKMGNAEDADAALQKAVEADSDGSQNVRDIAQKLLDSKDKSKQ